MRKMTASTGASPIAASGLIAMQTPMPSTTTVATADRTVAILVSRIERRYAGSRLNMSQSADHEYCACNATHPSHVCNSMIRSLR
jgi:hypothetical protein